MAGESGGSVGGKITKFSEYPNVKEAVKDRLSALPDSLLLLIFSSLRTKDVVRTCVLSKRWQHLWTDISEIVLEEPSFDIAKMSSFVDLVCRMLDLCKTLNKFSVSACYDKVFVSCFNFWVHFAVVNKVKDFALTCRENDEEVYVLPQILYSHSSLTSLGVGYVVLAPQEAIEWGSLKSLSIEGVELSDGIMEKILSGCPILEFLCLSVCSGLRTLNIRSPKLTTVVVEYWDFEDYETILKISAPYVLDLKLSWTFANTRLRIINLSSVVRATFFSYNEEEPREEFCDPVIMNSICQLLESLKSLKELNLNTCCIEVFTVLEMEGCELPSSNLSCLTVDPHSTTECIPGILGFLKSSPYLETLVIRGNYLFCKEVHITQDEVRTCLEDGNLDLYLLNLKTIKMEGYEEMDCELMLLLVKVLFKSAKVLEKIVISATKHPFYYAPNAISVTPAEFASKLIALPKASAKAVVLVR